MNIGHAAKVSGVSAKMIRHYESVGLLPAAVRTDAGYRQYIERDVHVLRFIKRARDLGFPIKTIADLLSLWHNGERSSRQVKTLAQEHIDELQRKIVELQSMQQVLVKLVSSCHGDDRPDCPILQDLAGDSLGMRQSTKKKGH